jgi:hypothetical protein
MAEQAAAVAQGVVSGDAVAPPEQLIRRSAVWKTLCKADEMQVWRHSFPVDCFCFRFLAGALDRGLLVTYVPRSCASEREGALLRATSGLPGSALPYRRPVLCIARAMQASGRHNLEIAWHANWSWKGGPLSQGDIEDLGPAGV